MFGTWCTSALTFTQHVLILNREHSSAPMLRTKELFLVCYTQGWLPDWLFSGRPFVVFCAYVLMLYPRREMAAVLIIDLLWSAQEWTESSFYTFPFFSVKYKTAPSCGRKILMQKLGQSRLHLLYLSRRAWLSTYIPTQWHPAWHIWGPLSTLSIANLRHGSEVNQSASQNLRLVEDRAQNYQIVK